MAAYTTADLLAAIKRRTFAPTSQNTFPNSELLALADEEMQTVIVPELMAVREEFFVTSEDVPVTAGQAAYDIPWRAIGMAAREVKLVDSSGSYTDLPQISPESISSDSPGTPTAFYLRDNQIVLYPTPNTNALTLRISYSRSPSRHVETSSAAVVSAVIGFDVNINAVPAAFTSAVQYDFIRATGGQEIVAMNLAAAGVGPSSLTMSVTPPSALRAGDYVALAGETPVVQLPREYRTCLAQATCVRVLKSLRMDGFREEKEVLDEMLEKARLLVSPRVVGEPMKILSPW
jgi:hypothetical protein